MKKALEIKNLKKEYHGNEVLKGIDLEIESGDFFALLGHNGAGKTTTINILTDLVNKTSGRVEVFGVDIDTDFSSAKKMIGVVPQEFNFNIFDTVMHIPVLQAGYYGVEKKIAIKRTEKYLKALGLWDKRNAPAMQLSGGMKRRLMIVRALIHEPKFLILDEPTAGVDVELRQSMWAFIEELRQSGMTILLTTHYLEEVEALCNKVAIISKGKIITSTSTKDLLSQLNEEVIVLDLSSALDSLPELIQHRYKADLKNSKELEVTINKSQSLNELFADLTRANISVSSSRNKSNRIEQLFINLTK